jgi:Fic family protein
VFQPKYSITPKLLENIKQITLLLERLKNKKYSKTVFMKLINSAHVLSTHSSTSIEGNPLPLTDVKSILKNEPKHIRDSEREVLNYNKVLEWLDKKPSKEINQFDSALILQIHQMVTDRLLIEDQSGKYRKQPVFVNDPQLRKTIYLPPDHQNVEELMNQLFNYVHKNTKDIDALILAGIFHKQFVIIHPFTDGNGRTVRIATKKLLSRLGFDMFKLFSFENYYNRNISKYFKNVGVQGNYYDIYEHTHFTPWLEYFTDGIIDELLRVSDTLEKEKISPHNILKHHHNIILKHIKKHGFITDKIYSTLVSRAKPTRNLDLNHLINMNLIEPTGKGKATIYRMK